MSLRLGVHVAFCFSFYSVAPEIKDIFYLICSAQLLPDNESHDKKKFKISIYFKQCIIKLINSSIRGYNILERFEGKNLKENLMTNNKILSNTILFSRKRKGYTCRGQFVLGIVSVFRSYLSLPFHRQPVAVLA